MQLAEGGDYTRSAARGYSIINKLLTVDVGLSNTIGSQAAAPTLRFFQSFAPRKIFFSFDRAGD